MGLKATSKKRAPKITLSVCLQIYFQGKFITCALTNSTLVDIWNYLSHALGRT
ncbi:hypothetical protein XMV201_001774 [Aliiroseovarius sp. xm-v-201]|nr:hypothetical protein [Aliiroseovarius sp. xm-d-517]NRP31675.1 hypothetical protein [Aliiroseovarius sp. xm-m-314]NRP42813.1 hypothetical protein [Aliiroseovarius sp. xm-m-339-2]NRP45943.1 hypothetical protein [Aliiroseovarius sp. xm-m-378]NRP50013.1 hypothetical protein [Aliiroseovarius sp. xm-m-354]NRP63696.1 hypothetical protein [Aliiroseovarius sp. xm-a-151]NRP66811.1 hypothetical protein [Aliiroseovarius sp. xm-v-225]NRP81317.1 hypothetical protein [Aliiroseovarius sp. xm-v-209]NRP93